MNHSIVETEQKFIVDSMLGTLAKKLRLLGYDCIYSSTIDDNEIIKLSLNENRIIITRDKQLVTNSKKMSLKVIQITEDSQEKQILKINSIINIRLKINAETTRCSLCNEKLEKIDKNLLSNIPKKVLDIHNDFWQCCNCKRVYWKGTHITKLQKFIDNIHDKTT